MHSGHLISLYIQINHVEVLKILIINAQEM